MNESTQIPKSPKFLKWTLSGSSVHIIINIDPLFVRCAAVYGFCSAWAGYPLRNKRRHHKIGLRFYSLNFILFALHSNGVVSSNVKSLSILDGAHSEQFINEAIIFNWVHSQTLWRFMIRFYCMHFSLVKVNGNIKLELMEWHSLHTIHNDDDQFTSISRTLRNGKTSKDFGDHSIQYARLSIWSVQSSRMTFEHRWFGKHDFGRTHWCMSFGVKLRLQKNKK